MNDEQRTSLEKGHKEGFLLSLEALLDSQFKSRDNLDKKAWDILTFTSGFIGLITSIQVGIAQNSVSKQYLLGFSIIVLLYILQVIAVQLAVNPRKWKHVPGTVSGKATLGEMLGRYVYVSDTRYFEQLLADYLGDGVHQGAISIAQSFNRQKSSLIQIAMILMSLIVLTLFAMSLLLI